MRHLLISMILAFFATASLAQDTSGGRYFLAVGQPNSEGWTFMIENPVDREIAMGKAMEAMGGEIIAYFWGLGDGKNYIISRMPDDPGMIQAMYVARLADGVLSSYELTELLSSSDMTDALKRVPEFSIPLK